MTDTCTLCDLPTPTQPVTDDGVTGSFCCRGCLEVARTLDDAETADPDAARLSLRDDPGANETAPPENAENAFLQVDGMHCATCEAFLEGVATDHDGVHTADASYAAGLLKLTYDPDALDLPDLPALVDGLGYRARHADDPGVDDHDVLGRLLVGGFFGMMTMLWYVLFLYPAYLGLQGDLLLMDLRGSAGGYLLANAWAMTSVVLFYTGYPILRGAYVSLRAGRPNMDLLVALAASTAYVYSTAAILAGHVEVYFDVTVVVVMAVTLGNYYEDRIRERAAGRLADLAEQRVTDARRRVSGGGTELVPVEELTPDDEVVVKSGDRVPVDGTVLEGSAAVDNSLVTGESLPVRVESGDDVIGGAVVTDGRLVLAPDPDGESTLDRLLALLWEVRASRPGAQRLADRIAAVFVPLVLLLAGGAFALHLALGATTTGALLTALAVLVVSCPCALGLATPLAVAAGIRDALAEGVVVGSGEVFERATDADVIAFDKTGTLTTGKMTVLDVAGDPSGVELAAAVEQYADHPVADAISEYAGAGATRPKTDGGTVTEPVDGESLDVEDFQTHPGRGVSARVGRGSADEPAGRVLVGRPVLFEAHGWTVPDDLVAHCERASDRGRVASLVGWDGRARSVVVAGDQPREGWETVVSDLAADHRVVVISGDSPAAARVFREHPAIDEVFAGVPPEAKAEVVSRLRSEGTTAMVGDGSNDAPALGAADVGIAMGGATALAADAADVVVTGDDLAAVSRVFDLTRATKRRIRQNLAWAFCYNAIALPVALVGLLNPLVAAGAMAASSLLVVTNSARSIP